MGNHLVGTVGKLPLLLASKGLSAIFAQVESALRAIFADPDVYFGRVSIIISCRYS
jgi:hypothetical protein